MSRFHVPMRDSLVVLLRLWGDQPVVARDSAAAVTVQPLAAAFIGPE